MVIDFHAHVFPDKLAPKAIRILTDEAHSDYLPVSDGTVSGLMRNMDDWQIDVSVI